MAFDGTDGWETFVVKIKPDQPEEFLYCFKPPNIHNPAPVMAKEIANMFETKFPKTWAALTNGSVVLNTVCGDGAPVVSKTVDEMRKYPQFFRARYYYDPSHGKNVTAKNSMKHSGILTGQVQSHLKRFATLANHSVCVKKTSRKRKTETCKKT